MLSIMEKIWFTVLILLIVGACPSWYSRNFNLEKQFWVAIGLWIVVALFYFIWFS